MKAFRFRLEKVRQIRESQRRESQAQFLHARRLLSQQLDRLAGCKTEVNRTESMYSSSSKGKTYASTVAAAHRYVFASEFEVAAQRDKVNKAEGKAEEARLDLVEKTKKKKTLDRLRERRAEEFGKEAQKEKQKQIDESARQGYFRRHRVAD